MNGTKEFLSSRVDLEFFEYDVLHAVLFYITEILFIIKRVAKSGLPVNSQKNADYPEKTAVIGSEHLATAGVF